MTRVAAQGIRFEFDAQTGKLQSFTVEDQERQIAPLHQAPWVGTDENMPSDVEPVIRTLGGDFFCAPFAGTDSGSALHGWPANMSWDVVALTSTTMRACLPRSVFGATLVKELSVRNEHPFVYQRHLIIGGVGRLPVANHANVALSHGGLIRTSGKSHWETPAQPQESDPARGRSGLYYPAQSDNMDAFPGVDGPVDLSHYPWNPKHEDFVIGIEASGTGLGWTAVTRLEEKDLFISLRNPRQLPMTMLWHSNGGRDYAPWSGRHFGCLGVEEGAADHMLGLSTEADLAGPGAITLRDGGVADIRHVIGAIAWPTGQAVRDIHIDEQHLEISGDDGESRRVPFWTEFLATGFN
ncbi:MAG: hypothetical protein NXI27_00825 [Alphaproteobacteria bacterium]|nr:hypothetical protein [Alphaproteobacteria bacterium]